MKKTVSLFLLAGWTSLLALPAQAQTTYHIGNSLTDTKNGMLEPLSRSAGRDLVFLRFTIPGAPTDWLWDHPNTGFGDTNYPVVFVNRAPIGHLFTQPFAGHDRAIDNEADYSGRFYNLCRQNSPDVQHWLYQQWPDKAFQDNWSQGKGSAAGLGLTPARNWVQGACNHLAYDEAVRQRMDDQTGGKEIRIVPAGLALAKLAIEIEAGRVPGVTDFFNTHFSDDLHLSDLGSYMVNLVHYACIYQESPVGKVTYKPAALTEAQATVYKQIAWDVTRDYPWSGLGGNGTLYAQIRAYTGGGPSTPGPAVATGAVVREVWTGIGGTAVSAIPTATPASGGELLTQLEVAAGGADNYGTRIRGYIVSPAAGWYTFHIAGDDNCELWLSSGPEEANKSRIAHVPGWTNPREWGKYPEQQSAQVYLVAGGRFYFEILQKEAGGGDHVAVGWTGPNNTSITVVPGSVLAPYNPFGTGRYALQAQHSSKVLDVLSFSTADGAAVVQHTPNGGTNQQWELAPAATAGYYTLTAAHSQKRLDVANASTANGATVWQYTANGTAAQDWLVLPVGGGYFKLLARCSGKALDVNGRSVNDGASIIQWDYHGDGNQRWRLVPAGTSVAQATAARPGAGSKPLGALDDAIFPNPATADVNLRCQAPKAGRLHVVVRDQLGRTVYETAAPVTAGENLVHFRLPDVVRSGVHTVSVSGGTAEPRTYKLLIAR
ncbi:RICIN domain-containing protein [Hymenobacter weizhouensis]|uniref:RICIN domain-containing protein n=1 Tax=Hymenobacter sp. YIM 151500-1 TaxID=2987689 RepID=UPI002227B993|nr:RICIN domain-containing protein [Hymenobacter sp. YIM 151500-1]UYZ62507.1 RICIN domain-containing protein [Hymenobacter sp. YIM 151500-1]